MRESPDLDRERVLRIAALGGDAAAWCALFEPAFDTVHSYVRWRCGGRADLVDDVVQETWFTAARKLRAFNPDGSRFAGWVCGIAANVARSQVRKCLRYGKRVQSLVAVSEPSSPEPDLPHDPERIALALADLPERYELALRMKYFEQMSVTEMATATGDSVKAVESLLARARQAFREAYQRIGGDTP
jgi:RNA polymerase sigma-70 factor (ECF subfamily)